MSCSEKVVIPMQKQTTGSSGESWSPTLGDGKEKLSSLSLGKINHFSPHIQLYDATYEEKNTRITQRPSHHASVIISTM